MFSLIKKKGDLTYSMSSIPNFGLFKKLSEIPRDWRNKFFLIEHENDFLHVLVVWTNEHQTVRRSSEFIEDNDLSLLTELHSQCSALEPSANICEIGRAHV